MGCECLLGQLGRVLIFILLLGGCGCSFWAAYSCEFFSYSNAKDPTVFPEPYTSLDSSTVGLFGRVDEEKDECIRYENNFFDAKDSDFNSYWLIAQLCALIGPGGAAMALIINMVEWFFWSNTFTYIVAIGFLLIAFAGQGLTFMVYGQREFCHDNDVGGDCTMELGSYMSIAATAAFYVSAIVWCCMPRSQPFCCTKENKNTESNAEKSQDYNDFFGANTVADMLDYKESNRYSRPMEPASVYDTGAAEQTTSSPWADSRNADPIPQQRPAVRGGGGLPPGFYAADDPNYGFQGDTFRREPSGGSSGSYHNYQQQQSGGVDPYGISAPMQHSEFDNPFVLDNNLPSSSDAAAASRPAYGNLQG